MCILKQEYHRLKIKLNVSKSVGIEFDQEDQYQTVKYFWSDNEVELLQVKKSIECLRKMLGQEQEYS